MVDFLLGFRFAVLKIKDILKHQLSADKRESNQAEK